MPCRNLGISTEIQHSRLGRRVANDRLVRFVLPEADELA